MYDMSCEDPRIYSPIFQLKETSRVSLNAFLPLHRPVAIYHTYCILLDIAFLQILSSYRAKGRFLQPSPTRPSWTLQWRNQIGQVLYLMTLLHRITLLIVSIYLQNQASPCLYFQYFVEGYQRQ